MINAKNILVIAAHPDDEVLGCGATMARFAAEGARVNVLLLGEGPLARTPKLDHETSNNIKKCTTLSAQAAAEILGVHKLICAGVDGFQGFPDNRFDTVALIDIVQFIEKIAAEINPDAIFTHHAGDLNIDHRITHEAVMTAFRPLPSCALKFICGFEVLSSTEYATPNVFPAFVPNFHVNTTGFMDKKQEALRAYSSEMRNFPHPRSYESVQYLASLRGSHNGMHAAESFICYRFVI